MDMQQSVCAKGSEFEIYKDPQVFPALTSVSVNEYKQDLKKLFDLVSNVLDELSCPICMETRTKPCAITKCGHMFCEGCILKWITAKSKCPLCKVDATKRSLQCMDETREKELEEFGKRQLAIKERIEALIGKDGMDSDALQRRLEQMPVIPTRYTQDQPTEEEERRALKKRNIRAVNENDRHAKETKAKEHRKRLVHASSTRDNHPPRSKSENELVDSGPEREKCAPVHAVASKASPTKSPHSTPKGHAVKVTLSDAELAKRGISCAFCNQAASVQDPANPETDLVKYIRCDSEGWLKIEGSSAYVHHLCAIWSPEVYLCTRTKNYINVDRAVRRAKKLSCSLCRRMGASLGCFDTRCKKRFHLSCARAEQGPSKPVLYANNYQSYCHMHEPEVLPSQWIEDEADFMTQENDTHDATCKRCGLGGNLLCCDGCCNALHLKCAIPKLTVAPKDTWYCHECKDRDDDIQNIPSPDTGDNPSLPLHTAASRSDSPAPVDPEPLPGATKPLTVVLLTTNLADGQEEMLKQYIRIQSADRNGNTSDSGIKVRLSEVSDISKITHLVHGKITDAIEPFRSVKFLRAMAARVPVIKFEWISDGIDQGVLKDPMEYEAEISKRCRVAHPLGAFYARCFDMSSYTQPKPSKKDLAELIMLASGKVITASSKRPRDEEFKSVAIVRNNDDIRKDESFMDDPDKAVSAAWILEQIAGA